MNPGTAQGIRGQRPVAGISVGILTLDTRHDLVAGNVQYARSFPFPVAYSVVENVSLPALMRGDEQALPAIVSSVNALQALGVDLIVGACGSFAHYQKEVAAIARVPVCLSILVEVPFILSLLPPSKKLAIVFARIAAFTERAKRQCNITDCSRIVTVGADALASFAPILDPTQALDSCALETDLVALLKATHIRERSIGAWLLQCSDLPPYATAIAAATGLPVFDMTTLIAHLERAARPEDYVVRGSRE
jgi:hypothetical protein